MRGFKIYLKNSEYYKNKIYRDVQGRNKRNFDHIRDLKLM